MKAGELAVSQKGYWRKLSPERVGWLQHHQLYSGLGADIVMESIMLITEWF
jgi:hypothetical protein